MIFNILLVLLLLSINDIFFFILLFSLSILDNKNQQKKIELVLIVEYKNDERYKHCVLSNLLSNQHFNCVDRRT